MGGLAAPTFSSAIYARSRSTSTRRYKHRRDTTRIPHHKSHTTRPSFDVQGRELQAQQKPRRTENRENTRRSLSAGTCSRHIVTKSTKVQGYKGTCEQNPQQRYKGVQSRPLHGEGGCMFNEETGEGCVDERRSGVKARDTCIHQRGGRPEEQRKWKRGKSNSRKRKSDSRQKTRRTRESGLERQNEKTADSHSVMWRDYVRV